MKVCIISHIFQDNYNRWWNLSYWTNSGKKYYVSDNWTSEQYASGVVSTGTKCLACGMITETGEIVFYYSMDQQKNKLLWYYCQPMLYLGLARVSTRWTCHRNALSKETSKCIEIWTQCERFNCSYIKALVIQQK